MRSAAIFTWSFTRIFAIRDIISLGGAPGGRSFGERAGEQLDRMDHLYGEALLAALPLDLHEASRIARGQHPRPGFADALDLAARELAGDLWLEEVVDPGAAAAEIALGQVHEREAGDAPEQRA